MRAMKRIRSMEERNERVENKAYRDAMNAQFLAQKRQQEMLEFVNAYETAKSLTERRMEYFNSPTGVYFPINVEIRLGSVKAELLQMYGRLFTLNELNQIEPILTPFDWAPEAPLYGYLPPPELLIEAEYMSEAPIRAVKYV